MSKIQKAFCDSLLASFAAALQIEELLLQPYLAHRIVGWSLCWGH